MFVFSTIYYYLYTKEQKIKTLQNTTTRESIEDHNPCNVINVFFSLQILLPLPNVEWGRSRHSLNEAVMDRGKDGTENKKGRVEEKKEREREREGAKANM
jgi:hypothetical protein